MTRINSPKIDIPINGSNKASGRGVSGGGLCNFPSYEIILSNADELKINEISQTIYARKESGFLVTSFFSEEEFDGISGIFSFEAEVLEIESGFSSFDLSFVVYDPVAEEIICGAYPTSSGAGQLLDAESGAPIGSITMKNGYAYGFKFNLDGEEVLIYDNQGNEGAGSINYVSGNGMKIALFPGTGGGSDILLRVNSGSAPFSLPQSEGRICRLSSVAPPIAFCSPFTITFSQLPPPNDQTMEIDSDDSQRVNVTSLGNTGLQSGVVGPTFNTQTEEVKYEAYLEKDTNTAGTQVGAFGLLYYDVANLVIVAGVQMSNTTGTIIDIVGGAPIATGQIFTPGDYEFSVYLDAASSQAQFKDSLSNDSSIAVSGSYDNLEDITMTGIQTSSSNIGEEIDVTYNFGDKEFRLGEDAERYCNL